MVPSVARPERGGRFTNLPASHQRQKTYRRAHDPAVGAFSSTVCEGPARNGPTVAWNVTTSLIWINAECLLTVRLMNNGYCHDRSIRAFRIDPASASAAWISLILLHDASVTPRKWRIFVLLVAAEPDSGRSGMIAMRDTRGITHAVLSYLNFILTFMPASGFAFAIWLLRICPGLAFMMRSTYASEPLPTKLDCQTITIEQLFSPRTGNPTDCSTQRRPCANSGCKSL